MGLPDKAIATIGDRAEYVSDPQLKAKIFFELAHCYIAKEDLERAHGKLTESLITLEPGPLAYEVALKLADICLKLNRDSEAVSVCSQLLDLQPSGQIKQKTLNLLAKAHHQQKNYNKAALALLGQWR